MSATAKGRIVKKIQNDTDVANIKLELINYQTIDLVYTSGYLGELPDSQTWVQVEYDTQTNTVLHIEPIQEPTLQQVAQQRKGFVQRQPVTKVFVVLAIILGFFVNINLYTNMPMSFILLGPFLLVLFLAVIARSKEW